MKEYEEFSLALSKARLDQPPEKVLPLEGKLTRVAYEFPPNRSTLEVFRNYEGALAKAGFSTLFTCKGVQELGGCDRLEQSLQRQTGWGAGYAADYRYLAAKLARPEGDVYVSLFVKPAMVLLAVVELKPMEAGLVTVNAEALAGDINRTGHVAVYGIYFDTGKADIKPESGPTLAEIAKLLQQNPQLKLHVVGHTDSVGELAMNMDLSKRRTQAVVQALSTKHGIAAARLHPEGVGPLSPVASNKTEEGRAQNRRVELVEQ